MDEQYAPGLVEVKHDIIAKEKSANLGFCLFFPPVSCNDKNPDLLQTLPFSQPKHVSNACEIINF